jgi:hypothetical protein
MKLFENLAPGTYYWQVLVQAPDFNYYYADDGAWWHFTVGGDRRTLTLTPANTGTGTGHITATAPGSTCPPNCTPNYPLGTVVTLRAVPDAASLFVGWSGACSGSAMAATVTVTDNLGCTATFGPAPPFPKLTPNSAATLQGNSLGLSWSAVPGAQSYWYCVGSTPGVTCDTGWVGAGTNTSALVTDLAPGVHYWPLDFAS